MEERPLLISILPPSLGQKRLALIAVVILSFACVLSIPFLQIQFGRLDVFVPLLDIALFLIDLITAALLYAHFSVLGSRSLLALASGYLFTALIILAHALTFPGAFSPTGLLGAGIQTSNYLQIIWRAGLPCAAIAYVLLKSGESKTRLADGSTRGKILASIIVIFMAVCSLIWLVTAGVGLLPKIMIDAEHRIWAVDAPFIIPLEIAAIVLIWMWRQSALDYWLLVVLWAWLIASLLVSATSYRFSLVWYESRFFGVVASSFVLLGLLTQMTTLYARLAIVTMKQRREQENRLVHVDATLAVVSHEINQPLAAIAMNGSAGLHELRKATPNSNALEEILKDVVRDGHRAGEIVNSIRAMFRKDDRGVEELDLVELVESALAMARGDLNEYNIAVETTFARKLPRVVGNRTQLHQLFLNLIMNAVEAMDRNRNRPRMLRVKAYSESRDVVVVVEDSGRGIDPGIGDRMFDPFVTTKSKGTGLGLSISRTIVEGHGGRISAGKNPVGGASIIVSIPARPGGNQ